MWAKNTIFKMYIDRGLEVDLKPYYLINHSDIIFKYIPFVEYIQGL